MGVGGVCVGVCELKHLSEACYLVQQRKWIGKTNCCSMINSYSSVTIAMAM